MWWFWKQAREEGGSVFAESLPKVPFVLGTPLSYLHIYEK